MSAKKRPSHPHHADIELLARVRADALRFAEAPETEVRFFGEPGHESASGSDRTNLPDEVEPGVTYRNITVDYRLASRLAGPWYGPRARQRHPGGKDGPQAR